MIFHRPVLAKEVTDLFDVKQGNIYIDATLGHGGHTIEILKRGGLVYGIDADPEQLQIATDRIKDAGYNSTFHPLCANFSEITTIQTQIGFPVSGILFDLGLNSYQQKASGRGFSFNDTQSLDMRLNPEIDALTAEEIINTYDYSTLVTLFSKLSQEKLAKPIAQSVITQRQHQPIKNATKLAEIIKSVYDQHHVNSHLNPATKVFMALRITVNHEFDNIALALNSTLAFNSSCIVTVITFHSGEDRLVKQFIRTHSVTNLTPKPIRPGIAEIQQNPLSRSATLRSYRID